LPVYRCGVISIYEYLEHRLGRGARLLGSGCFLLFRGVATGVTVYGVASLLSLIAGVEYLTAVVLLMGVTVVYDVLGGMRAVVISDVVQLTILLCAVVAGVVWLGGSLEGQPGVVAARSGTLINDWGLGSGNNYGFWPMLFGGVFLYAAYYGCDQSQAQRLLSARNEIALGRILLINGVARFPVVALYCVLGIGLAAYAADHPGFIQTLPETAAGDPNLNMVFPAFAIAEFPDGLVGLVIVGLFAAAMSSIDSSLNSLSAATLEDFFPASTASSVAPKIMTFVWGSLAIAFSFSVESIAPTVLESVNRIGSMANGSLLALFVVATGFRQWGQSAAIVGFFAGLCANGAIWYWLPEVSWLWWNVTGCVVALVTAAVVAQIQGHVLTQVTFERPARPLTVALGSAAVAILAVLFAAEVYISWQ